MFKFLIWRTLAGMFVDLCDWVSANLHYHRYFSECGYAVQRIAVMWAKAMSRNGLQLEMRSVEDFKSSNP